MQHMRKSQHSGLFVIGFLAFFDQSQTTLLTLNIQALSGNYNLYEILTNKSPYKLWKLFR